MTEPVTSRRYWDARLGTHFFRDEYARTHVMFFVDDHCLTRLSGLDAEDARRAFVQATMMSGLFTGARQRATQWRCAGARDDPPFLAALGLAVMAATRMSRQEDRAAHNYYVPLLELLSEAGSTKGPDEVIDEYRTCLPPMWRQLEWWLNDHLGGSRGLSTIAEDPHRTRLGYADSQTVFKSSDRDKLSQFFQWMKLEPGTRMDPSQLLVYFRIFAATREDLSEGTRLILTEDDDPRQLVEILAAEAARWEGVVRDGAGRTEGRIAVTLSLRPPPPRLGLAAERPPGFPGSLEVRTPTGELVALRADDIDPQSPAKWYEGWDPQATGSLLDNGLTMRSEGHVLRLPPYSIHILHRSAELGCWASAEQLLPGEPAWLLVRTRQAGEVLKFLAAHAREEPRPVDRPGLTPRGWLLIRDVVIDRAPAEPPPGLSRLVPRSTNRLGFEGGLPIDLRRRVYLTAGEPDVKPPPLEGVSLVVDVDGAGHRVDSRTGVLALRGLDLAPGAHEVEIAGVRDRLTTMHTLGEARVRGACRIGHLLSVGDERTRPLTQGGRVVEREPLAGQALIEGAVVHGGTRARRTPIVLPVGATHVVLVGARPGQIETVTPPSKPRWMERVGLHYQVFEHEPSFSVAWVILSTRWRGELVRPYGPLPVADADGHAADRTSWAQAICACASFDRFDDSAQQRWQQYVDAATRITS